MPRTTEVRSTSLRAPPVAQAGGELARLRGRNVGTCANCGRLVYVEHNFTRFAGRVVHVRCPISGPARVA